MSSTYGDSIKLSIFGQSHGKAIGMTLDGVPAGLPVDLGKLQGFLNRRAPGQHCYDTPRKEEDVPEFLAGILNERTCGAPIAAVIYNKNTRSSDYSNLLDCPRPGHADYTAQIKYNGFQDPAGGGHFSGRITAPLCVAGGLCIQWLELQGIHIAAHIHSIAGIEDYPIKLSRTAPDFSQIQSDFAVLNADAGNKMKQAIINAKDAGDSVGGIIECIVTGYPAGLGGPLFGGVEGKIAQAIYGVPAVKGVEFGAGFEASSLLGSQNNDSFIIRDGRIETTTNHCGGILGGITNGMPIIFRVAIKPTPSITKTQHSISIKDMAEQKLQISGRHDPCIVPRAVPVIEAVTAIALYDLLLSNN